MRKAWKLKVWVTFKRKKIKSWVRFKASFLKTESSSKAWVRWSRIRKKNLQLCSESGMVRSKACWSESLYWFCWGLYQSSHRYRWEQHFQAHCEIFACEYSKTAMLSFILFINEAGLNCSGNRWILASWSLIKRPLTPQQSKTHIMRNSLRTAQIRICCFSTLQLSQIHA